MINLLLNAGKAVSAIRIQNKKVRVANDCPDGEQAGQTVKPLISRNQFLTDLYKKQLLSQLLNPNTFLIESEYFFNMA